MKRTEIFQFSNQHWIPTELRGAVSNFVDHIQPSEASDAMRVRLDDLENVSYEFGGIEKFHNKDSILNMLPQREKVELPVQSIRDLNQKQALRLLTHSAWERRPITIVTLKESPFKRFSSILTAPFYSVYFTLTTRPLPFSTFVFTFLVPILPLMATWDLIATMLGNYSEEELNDLAEHIHVPGYRFKTGRIVERGRPACHYLIGYPELRKAA
jgi:hypothetical protein